MTNIITIVIINSDHLPFEQDSFPFVFHEQTHLVKSSGDKYTDIKDKTHARGKSIDKSENGSNTDGNNLKINVIKEVLPNTNDPRTVSGDVSYFESWS